MFRISRRPEWLEEVFGVEHIVEKVLDGGEAYTLATFKDVGLAIAMLSLMASTVEHERGGHVSFGEWTT